MRTALILISLALAGAAQAQSREPTSAQAAAGFMAADRELKELHSQIHARLRLDQRDVFSAAQDAWERYRNAECDFGLLVLSRSVRTSVLGGCLEQMTRERIKTLQAVNLACGDGCAPPTK